MRFGVVTFPGSNCDYDCYNAVKRVLKEPVEFIWHADTTLHKFDCIIIPGGFSYGDYLRTGAIAHFANIMGAVKRFGGKRRPGDRDLQRFSDPYRSGNASRRPSEE